MAYSVVFCRAWAGETDRGCDLGGDMRFGMWFSVSAIADRKLAESGGMCRGYSEMDMAAMSSCCLKRGNM